MAKASAREPETGTSDLDGLGWTAHLVPGVLGVAALIASFFAQQSHIQITLTVTLIVVGVLLIGLAYASMTLRSRAAWSFLIAMTIVLGVMTLFGAPKIRSLVGLPWAAALVIPLMLFGSASMLGSIGQRYKT